MKTRRFGSLAVEIPIVGIGTWQMERDDPASAVAAIKRAIEHGMTHVDTAEMYGDGRVETLVADGIAGARARVFLASKVLPKNATYEGTLRACEASLRRLGTDHLDLYMLHWPGPHPLADTFRAFETLVEQGKIRAWGVSNFDDHELADAIAIAGPNKIACNQVLYHLGQRDIEHLVIPQCEKHGIAAVGYSPFGSRGRFRPGPIEELAKQLRATPRQIALAYLSRKAFVIPKSSSPAHVDELAGADGVTLDAAAIMAIEAAFPLAPWKGLPTI
ncbi:MAG: aldo/keto reductase [Deltaproteobacteria bacterium]|nr:aldo/keto reductase [Deltaproteobacteria bacterium]